ncbi:MAG: glycosyltransferase family 25 protein [Proteobacteria bacterium]|nr:glycosyltransferase family 25 protein [Pseudomonadota bacterium]
MATVFLVNLDDAVARRRHMAAELARAGVTWRRVGIDLRHADEATLVRAQRLVAPRMSFERRRLGNAELGCWLSHVDAWRQGFADPAVRNVAVIEDDLCVARDFGTTVDRLVDRSTHDVVFLGTSSRNISARRRVRCDGVALHEPVGAVFNTWGYVIGRAYAQRLQAGARDPIAWPIDHVLGGRIAAWRPQVAVVQPLAIVEHAALARASQIQASTRRLDRLPWVEAARRWLLASRASDLYYSLYRWL